MSLSLPFDRSSSGESKVGLLDYRNLLQRLVDRSLLLSGGIVFFGILVSLTFVAYLVGIVGANRAKLIFALYVVLTTVLYALTLVWGNVEQRRSRRASAAPELVLEPVDGDLLVGNVGAGPAIDARVAVTVDGERVYDDLLSVFRSGSERRVASIDFGDDADVVLSVWAGTRLTDVEYQVERTYDGETLHEETPEE